MSAPARWSRGVRRAKKLVRRYLAPPHRATPPAEPASPRDIVRRWQRLRQTGEGARADELLRSAVAREGSTHPGFTTGLFEELVLAEAWPEAIEMWNRSGMTLTSPDVTPKIAGLLTRAHRAIDDLRVATDIAEAGLDRWPDGTILRKELAKVRSRTTDWAAAIRIAGDRTAALSGASVRSLGALAGDDGPIEGWVPGGPAGRTTVAIVVDGTTVTTTHAGAVPANGTSDARPFSLRCDQVLEYLGDGNQLSVTADDAPLLLPGGGTVATFLPGYPSRVDELRERLEAGHVFNKRGGLRAGHTPESKHRTIELYRAVGALVEEVAGQTCTPFYGNLLGAIREQDFIAHDVGGFDMGYVSEQVEGAAVRDELVRVAHRLLDEGYHLVLEPWSFAVRERRNDRMFVDLNVGRFSSTGELQLSFGWRYAPVTDVDGYRRLREATLASETVPVPGCAEAVLEQCYGPRWTTPDQGFDIGHRLRREPELLLTRTELLTIVEHRPTHARIATEMGPDGAPIPWQGAAPVTR